MESALLVSDSQVSRKIEVGTITAELLISEEFPLGKVISDAFLPSSKTEVDYRVVVLQAEDLPRLPPTAWAAQWIQECRPVPTILTTPYRVFIDRNQGFIYCFDPQSKLAAVYLRSASRLDHRSLITPFRVLWSWLASEQNMAVIHASAISSPEGATVFVGRSGSGKSSIAVESMISGGSKIIADDCVWVDDNRAHACFSRVKLDERMISKLPRSLRDRVIQLDNKVGKPFLQVGVQDQFFTKLGTVSKIVLPRLSTIEGTYSVAPQRVGGVLVEDSMRELFGGSAKDALAIYRFLGKKETLVRLIARDERRDKEMP